jgi:hypothetical protein
VKRGGFSQVIAYSNVSFLENNHAVVTFNLDEDAARFNLDEGLSIVSGDQTVAFGLECNTQALLLHSPADEALLTTINFGSFDQGVLVSGDFHWSYDSSPDQVIEWVNREEGALQGLPLIY